MSVGRSIPRTLALTVAFGVGLLCLVAAVAGLFGGGDPRLDLFTHFAPFWVLGGTVAAFGGLVLARGAIRRVGLLIGGAAALAGGARLIPDLTLPIRPAVPAGEQVRLRLVQFNIWDENANPAAAADWIARQGPDLVTIEENTPAFQAAMIARGFDAVQGRVNTAIFSRGLAHRPQALAPFPGWTTAPDFALARFSTVRGGPPFPVVAVHLSWPNMPAYWPEREALIHLAEGQSREGLILAGDFNLTPWSFALTRLDHGLGLERRDRAIPSWPAKRPVAGVQLTTPAILPIDHVYAGPRWRTVAIRRGPNMGSDHYPLIVDFVPEP